MAKTYKKTLEGKLEIKETLQDVQVYSLEEIRANRATAAASVAFHQARLDELDALLLKAAEIGIVGGQVPA